jgi:hypothetical protein
MNTIKIPISLHLFGYLVLNEGSKNSSVVLNERNWRAAVELGLVGWPPARDIYGSMYCEQVIPAGGSTEKEQYPTKHVLGESNENLSRNPSRPTIHLARPFPDLVNHPVYIR